jgi:hypothetical protein
MAETPNRNKLYAAATAQLREQHRHEFEVLLAEQYKAAGLVYKRRLTAEERAVRDRAIAREKARQKAETLAREFPELGLALDATS